MDGSVPNPLPPDTSNAPALLVILWITLGPAIVLVCLRMYTKIHIHRHVHWDDYIICLALVRSPLYRCVKIKTL